MPQLFNPRGRLVTVEDKEVPDLLRRGFMYPDQKENRIVYNPVYDKGEQFKPELPQDLQSLVAENAGDVLETEVI